MNFYGTWYYDKDIEKIELKKYQQYNLPISSIYSYNTEPITSNWKLNSYNNKEKWILCLAPWAKIGGADLFNLKLFEKLKLANYKIVLITTETQDYELRQTFEEVIDEYYDLTTFIKRELWPEFIDFIIKDKNIKLVFQLSSLYGYHIIPWIKSIYPKLPIIDYLHAEDFSWRAGGFPKDSVAIANYLDKTYTCTKHLKKLMFNNFNHPTKNIEVAYIGTDYSFFNPDKIKIFNFELKEKLKHKKVVLFPSRFSPEKRPILFLRIIKELNKKNQDIVGLMVGGGVLNAEIIKYHNKLKLNDIVYILPMQEDIRQYYYMSDLVLICSLSEGLTLTTFEALSMGLPVVSANVGAQKEAIIDENYGKIISTYQNIEKDLNNYNYSDKEIDEYCDAILNQLSNNKSEKKDERRKYVIHNFSQEKTFKKIILDIDKLIKSGSKISINNKNIELTKRYLVLFNETSKVFYDNNNFDYTPQSIIQRLWKYPIFRFSIKVAKKFKIDVLVKKIINRRYNNGFKYK